MTAQTMLEKLAEELGAQNDGQLSLLINLSASEVCKIRKRPDRGRGMRVASLASISARTGVPIGRLAEWWAESE